MAGYLLVGTAKIYKASYRNEYVRLHDVDGSATLHVTPTELLLTALTGYLPGGGSAAGELRIANWLGEVPPTDVAASSATTKAAVTTTNKTAKTIGAKAPIDGDGEGAAGADGACLSDCDAERGFRCGRLWM